MIPQVGVRCLSSSRHHAHIVLSQNMHLQHMLEERGDWCISRQRSWGVPIPAFFHRTTGDVLLDQGKCDKQFSSNVTDFRIPDIVTHVASLVQSQGTDVWWTHPVDELLPPSHRHLAAEYRKGTDTMDVWLDSGVSWMTALSSLPSETHALREHQVEIACEADLMMMQPRPAGGFVSRGQRPT